MLFFRQGVFQRKLWALLRVQSWLRSSYIYDTIIDNRERIRDRKCLDFTHSIRTPPYYGFLKQLHIHFSIF